MTIRTRPADAWAKKTMELPTVLFWRLKARAAEEQRPMRETLAAAVAAYLEAPARSRGRR